MHEKTGKIQRPSLQFERLPHRCEGRGPAEPKLKGERALVQKHRAAGGRPDSRASGFAEERGGLVVKIVNEVMPGEEGHQ